MAFLLLGLVSCSHLSVKSDPPGGRLVYSESGLPPYKPWPPGLALSGDNRTPVSSTGFFGNSFFVTVEKDGYRTPLPQLVELYRFHRDSADFKLEELETTIAARYTSQGYVKYNGQWVDPVGADLAEYEGEWMPRVDAEIRGNKAKGLVIYDGEWIPAYEAKEREDAKHAAEGLVDFKDRWETPDVVARETAIDNEVAAIRKEKVYPDLEAPRILAKIDDLHTHVDIVNDTDVAVRVLFSGITSREFQLAPNETLSSETDPDLIFAPARYAIVMIPAVVDDVTKVRSASWPLLAGTQVQFRYDSAMANPNKDAGEASESGETK